MSQKKIFYWAPFLVPIATSRAVINSCHSVNKFSKKSQCSIINFFGEFNHLSNEILNKKIRLLNLYKENLKILLPKHGFIGSRLSFFIIFIFSFFPLKNLLKKEKPDYLIIHLVTSLPLILLILFNYKTKFILRVSGLPKLNFFRKILWKLAAKKLYCITCPTKKTLEIIQSHKLINDDKLKLLYDPVIENFNFSRVKILKTDGIQNEKFYFAAGRLTKQKNFLFLCRCFKNILKDFPNEKLLIAGEGEDRKKLEKFIEKNNLEKNIHLLGYIGDIFPFFKNCKGFILSSLWEDPGFVLIESAIMRSFIFSSNCMSGPNEIIKDNFNGIIFNNNDEKSFINKFNIFHSLDKKKDQKLLINNLKFVRRFSLFNHYKNLDKILFSN